jgi:o-succinylbenzoate synthase
MPRIVKVETIPVSIPMKAPFAMSSTVGTESKGEYIILKITTEDGIIGIGESSPFMPITSESQLSEVMIIEKSLKPLLLGEDIFNVEKIWSRMESQVPRNTAAKASVDMALYDAMGKALGVPIYKLLGGKTRDRIQLCWGLSIRSSSEIADIVTERVGKGFKALKLKIGIDPRQDVKNVETIRNAVGEEVTLRLDANQAYTKDEALRVLKKFEPYGIEFIEQPLRYWDLDGMTSLRSQLSIPIASDESLYTFHDAMTLVKRQAVDVVNIKLSTRTGGFTPSKKVAAICEAEGIPNWVGSSLEFGIGTAASLHFATAIGNVKYACDLTGGWVVEDVIAEDTIIENGCAVVPEKPGLGITLREDVIRRYRVEL